MRGQAEMKQPTQPDLEIGDREEKETPSIWARYKPWIIGTGVTLLGAVAILLSKRFAGETEGVKSKGLIPSGDKASNSMLVSSSGNSVSNTEGAVEQSSSSNSLTELSGYSSPDRVNFLLPSTRPPEADVDFSAWAKEEATPAATQGIEGLDSSDNGDVMKLIRMI